MLQELKRNFDQKDGYSQISLIFLNCLGLSLFRHFTWKWFYLTIFEPPSPKKSFSPWKFCSSWKFGLYFAYIFIADWNLLTKFRSFDPICNRNILTSLYLKSETSAHAQLRNYSLVHTIYTFHDMVLVGNLSWGYLSINGVFE